MKQPLRILLIDDNPDDRALVARELRRALPDIAVEHITDAKTLHAHLQSDQPHLVITDYQLRWTDGLTVLREIKSQWPELPVIMFTGTGSEEIAVEAMKAGLDDYILKTPGHYARLPAAVQLALNLHEQRRMLKASESRYQRLFDSIPSGVFHLAPDGQIVDANPALLEMLRCEDPQEILGTNLQDLFLDPHQFAIWRTRLESEEVLRGFEAKLRRLDRSPCVALLNARALRNSRGSVTGFEGSMEDVTDQKRVEEERERLILELQEALAKIKTLGGLLPICASCKKIRDDKGYWNQIEVFIETHSDAEFTHSFCPECLRRLYPELEEHLKNEVARRGNP